MLAAVAAVAVAVLFLVSRAPVVVAPSPAPQATEWEISSSAGVVSDAMLADAQTYRIGPDEIDVAGAAKVEVVQKSVKRTRLVLRRGVLTARIEPGRVGRDFVIDSPPFRVTVVGTVFHVRREGEALQVATSKGVVRVERLSPTGEVLASQLVPAGSDVELHETEDAATVPVVSPTPAPKVLGPTKPTPAMLLGWRQRAARGECEAVLEETDAALRLAPTHVATLRVNADCARKLGSNAAAVAGYRKVISNSAGTEAAEAMLLAASLLQDELHDVRGVLDVTKAIRGAPPEVAASLHVRRARAYQTLGRKAEARAEVELILRNLGATPAAADALRLKSEL